MNCQNYKLRPLTQGPRHHWFGYYEKSPWDAAGRRILAMEVDFCDHPPDGTDAVLLGIIEPGEKNRFQPFAETTAWAWQTGCMLQWMPDAPDRRVIYNVRRGNTFGAVIHDLANGAKRELPMPIFCVAPDGRTAISLNFARLHDMRPGYGYPGVPDPWADQIAPETDGIYRIDLANGETRLILSLAQLAEHEPAPDMAGSKQWVNHIQINTDGTRFGVLHRYRGRVKGWNIVTRFFTANMDGSDLYLLNPNRYTSHYDWRDRSHVLAWARTPDSTTEDPRHYYILFTDKSREYQALAPDLLLSDGHCSWSPDRRWILTDTYPHPSDSKRTLLLYCPADNRLVELGRYLSPPELKGELRCDLHPRWRRDGRAVCFDSVHEGTRQMYAIELSEKILAH